MSVRESLRDNALGMVLDMSALPAPLRLMARLSPDPAVNGPLDPPSLLAIDPPDHTRLRRLVSKVFTPRAVDGLRGEVERAADALLDAMADEGTVDLVGRCASRLPVTVIATILGVPAAMHAQFLAWGTAAAATLDFGLPYGAFRRVERAQQAINTWLRGHFEGLRRDPGEDILSQLVRLVDDGDRLTETELIATAQLLLAAGFETTVNLLGNGAALLMEHPDQLEYLRSGPDRWRVLLDPAGHPFCRLNSVAPVAPAAESPSAGATHHQHSPSAGAAPPLARPPARRSVRRPARGPARCHSRPGPAVGPAPRGRRARPRAPAPEETHATPAPPGRARSGRRTSWARRTTPRGHSWRTTRSS
ncbi:hypothetical protein [Frankia sp. EAN1pec]|uniref:hypothetical protein n=1 Tax=Parafrankia sp. (strain EAN1pec) TaxID=298653 RepID=UPI0012F74B0D